MGRKKQTQQTSVFAIFGKKIFKCGSGFGCGVLSDGKIQNFKFGNLIIFKRFYNEGACINTCQMFCTYISTKLVNIESLFQPSKKIQKTSERLTTLRL